MNVNDVVEFVKMPPGETMVKRVRLPLGQCGVVLDVSKDASFPTLYKVDFGCLGQFWLARDNIKRTTLVADPKARDRDAHNIEVLRHRGHLAALAELAIDIALGCPLERSGPGYYTYARRDTVRAIRRILERAGIPWKQQHKELRRK